MTDAATSSASTTVVLHPICWTQTLGTDRLFAMHVEAEASKRGGGRLTVPGLGNILELPFELRLVRGPADWSLPELPIGTVGYLACYENRFNEFWLQQRTVVGGAISLPEAVFDDIWERVRLSPDFYSIIWIAVSPVRALGAEGAMWDRAKDKFLFVTETRIAFKRDGREPSTQG